MISGVEGVDPARRQMLIEMLDIDLSWWATCHRLADAMHVGLQIWSVLLPLLHTAVYALQIRGCCVSCRRLNKVSDGQRRRVQICLGLLRPYEVTGCSHSWQSSWALPSCIPTARNLVTMLQVLLLDEITVDMDVVGR